MASMRCTSRRCGSAQECGYFFHVALHESDVATRCAQVNQLSAASWAQHPDENPLLDIVNTHPPADRRLNSMCSQGGFPRLTTTGMYTWDMTSPVLLPYATIGVTSNPCQVLLPLYTSATTRVRLIRLRVTKAVNRLTPSNSTFYSYHFPLVWSSVCTS